MRTSPPKSKKKGAENAEFAFPDVTGKSILKERLP